MMFVHSSVAVRWQTAVLFSTCLIVLAVASCSENKSESDRALFATPLVQRLFVKTTDKPVGSAVFHLINRTDRDIRILKADAGCVCTDLRIASYTVPAGGKSEIRAEVDLKRASSVRRVPILIQTDSLEFPTLRLEIFVTGELERTLPSTLTHSIPGVVEGETFESAILLPIDYLVVEQPESPSEVELRVNRQPGDQIIELIVEGIAPEEPGLYHYEFVLRSTNSKGNERCKFNVQLEVISSVRYPDSVSLGVISPAKSRSTTFEIVGVKSPISTIQFKHIPDWMDEPVVICSDGVAYVELRCDPTEKNGLYTGTLVGDAQHADFSRKFSITVTCRILGDEQ